MMEALLRFARRHPRLGVATLSLILAGPGPATATAQERLPDSNAGTGQYVEPVPDAGGDRRAVPGAGPRRRELPARTRDRLPPGEEGRTLERLATDPGSGAPPRGEGGAARAVAVGPGGGGGSLGAGGESAIDAVAGAALGDDGPGAPIVLFLVAALTLAGAVLAARRRGGRR